MSEPLRFVLAGGGTGGHLFPAVAIAEALAELCAGGNVAAEHRAQPVISFAGARKKIEGRVVPALGYPFDPVWIAGFQRRLTASTLLLPVKAAVALAQSHALLRRRRPDVVIGTGGYVSGPVLYAAACAGRKTLIVEENEVPGATTRLLAPRVDEVHIAFAATAAALPRAKRCQPSGNPVRRSLRRGEAGPARERFGLRAEGATLLVLGGSLGASSINRAVRALQPRLAERGVQLLWQTGAADHEAYRDDPALTPPAVALRPFIDDMNDAYAAATLVLCRAGATTVAELTALGIPAVLVPYPHATANHQYRNAAALAREGAALLVEDARLCGLGDALLPLLADAAARDAMAARSRALGKPDAADTIARAVLVLARQARDARTTRHARGATRPRSTRDTEVIP